MRISDWSSDVCSSDLGRAIFLDIADHGTLGLIQPNGLGYVVGHSADLHTDQATGNLAVLLELLDHTHGFIDRDGQRNTHEAAALRHDRKSDVKGKKVSIRVDLGGRRIIKKKKQTNKI